MPIDARDAIAHCLHLLMGRGMFDTPEEWADAVLKRLDHEGYCVVPKEPDANQFNPLTHYGWGYGDER